MRAFPVHELLEDIGRTGYGFIGRSSFERRGFSAFSELRKGDLRFAHFISSREESLGAKELRETEGISNDIVSDLDTHNPLGCQVRLLDVVRRFSAVPGEVPLILDITTFRREELLILLNILASLPAAVIDRTIFLYTVAGEMGKWLSNNVRAVRPVIGFPGAVDSAKRTHLVLLSGIEHHRALATIDAYEPSGISLGMVPLSKSVSPNLFERNLELRNFLTRHFDQIEFEFDFSATDPSAVKKTLADVVSRLDDVNVVIAPLNTKLSTLGAGAFALENREVQLCYAEVDVYNSRDYSVPGERIVRVDAREVISATPVPPNAV